MLQREPMEAVMMEIAHQQGQSLNGRDRLAIRTGVVQTIQEVLYWLAMFQ